MTAAQHFTALAKVLRRSRRWLLALAFVFGIQLAGPGSAPATTANRSAARGPHTVVTVALIRPSRDADPTSAITIRAPLTPANRRSLGRLRATPARFDNRYRRVLEAALQVGGVLTAQEAIDFASGMEHLPVLRIGHGVATLRATSRFGSPWLVDGASATLAPSPVPADTDLRVAVQTGQDVKLQALSPLPAEQPSAQRAVWRIGGAEPPEVRVRIAPWSGNGPDLAFLKELSFALVAALPFLLLLFATARGIPAFPGRALAACGVMLGVAWAGFTLVQWAWFERPLRLVEHGASSSGEVALSCAVPLFALLVVGLLALRVQRAAGTREHEPSPTAGADDRATVAAKPERAQRSPRGRVARLVRGALLLPALIVGLLVTVLAAGAAFSLPLTVLIAHDAVGIGWHDGGESRATWAVALAGFGAVALAVFVLLANSAWVLVVAPRRWRGPAGRLHPAWAMSAAVLVALGLALQWWLAVHAELSRFGPVGFAAVRDGGPPEMLIQLDGFLGVVPIILGNLSLNVLAMVLAGFLTGVLWVRSGAGEPSFLARGTSFALALLFGVAVVGTGGMLYGYAAPIAFALAVAGLTVALPWLARREGARYVVGDGERPGAAVLLELAAEAARVEHLESAARSGADAPVSAGTDQQHLRRSAATAHPEPRHRDADILAAGLYGDSGARARLLGLQRDAWWVVAIPAAYGVYSTIHDQGHSAVSAGSTFGIAFLVVSILSQVITWPAAAWCFAVAAPVIPGRHGLVKGAAASLAYIVPAALAAWVLGDARDGTNWLFMAAELALLFIALGVMADHRRVRERDMGLRQLGELYRLTSLRAAAAYGAPVAVLLFTVVHGLATGKGAAALGDLVANAPTLLPGGGGH